MISPPEVDAAGILCDWVEASVLFQGRLSRTDIEDALVESTLATNETADLLSTNIWREAARRQLGCSGTYPMRWSARSAERRHPWEQAPAYTFMLLLSLTHHYSALRLNSGAARTPALLFEFICCLAYQLYVGGHALRFGHPRQHPLPASFRNAIQYLCRETREEQGHVTFAGPQLKDDGLDIVAWRDFADRRPGQLVLLGQCAIGRNWPEKLTELAPQIWKGHIRWGVDPVTTVAIPIVHPEGRDWYRNLATGGVIFDRLRVASLVESSGKLTAQLRRDTIRWCRSQIPRLSAVS